MACLTSSLVGRTILVAISLVGFGESTLCLARCIGSNSIDAASFDQVTVPAVSVTEIPDQRLCDRPTTRSSEITFKVTVSALHASFCEAQNFSMIGSAGLDGVNLVRTFPTDLAHIQLLI